MSQIKSSGTSINFDAQALHDAEEAEYHREEKERENELRAALLNAFDDDLSDEDSETSRDAGTSLMSLESNGKLQPENRDADRDYDADGGVTTPDLQVTQDPMVTPFPVRTVLQHLTIAAHTSTPMNGTGAPPLATPITEQCYHDNHQWNPEGNPDYLNYGNYGNYQYGSEGYYGNRGLTRQQPNACERGEIEGANDDDNVFMDRHGYQGNKEQFSNQQQYHHGSNFQGNYAYYAETNYMPESQPYVQTDPMYSVPTHEPANMTPSGPNSGVPAGEVIRTALVPTISPSQDIDSYKVTYHGASRQREPPVTGGATSPDHESPPRPTTPGGDYEDLQKDFLNTGSNHQAEQLQILYAARGRKLEEVTQQLKLVQDDSDREIRILKHKLTLAQGERDGLSTSLDQCQQMLKEGRQKDADLNGKILALELQVQALETAKEQLIKTLRSNESTIESLNAQLINLEASESLTRARDQHQSIVSSLNQKHEAEIYILKEKLDQGQRSAEDKDSEIENLRKQVAALHKMVEDSQINRADTINRLTRSLEDSQRQCQDLLESGSGQELSKLKYQLQDIIAGKSITEDINSALQDEVKELKEQVMMFESISMIGVLSNTAVSSQTGKPPAVFDDSYAQLGIKSSESPALRNWQTPDTNRSNTPTLSTEETIQSLKAELERCLQMYKKKYEQVSTLQQQLKTIKISLDDLKTKLTDAEQEAQDSQTKLKSLEDKLGDAATAQNPREVLTKKELEKLTQERDVLSAELKEVKNRLEETAANEETVSELNRDLSTQMSQMIQEFDEDKRQSLDKCREVVLKHHEEMRTRLEKDLQDQYKNEMADLEKQWQEKYDRFVSDRKELDEVKNLYVVVCQEKDRLKEQLEREYAQKVEEQTKEIKSKLEEEKQTEFEELKTTLSSTSQTSLVVAKEKWVKDQEAEVVRKIESEVARSKADWFTEHQRVRDQAVERSLKVNNLEWQQKWDTELHGQLETELNKVQEHWDSRKQAEFQKRLDDKLTAAKQYWLETEIPRAKQTWWDTELQDVVKQVKEEAMERATKESQQHERSVDEAVELAKQQWQEEKQLSIVDDTQLQHTCESLKLELDQLKTEKSFLEKDLDQRKSTWEQEKLSLEQELEQKKLSLEQDMEQNSSTWEQDKLSLELELEQIKSTWEQEKSSFERRESAWQLEKEELIEEKDSEKRQAILQVHEQAEQEYKQFLEEHSDTLNKALSTAREQHDYEMEELKKQCAAEVDSLRQNCKSSPDVDEQSANDRRELRKQWEEGLATVTAEHQEQQVQWEARLAVVTAEHEAEKTQLLALHRENMTKALEEARKRWQKKLQESQEQNVQTVLLQREQQWEEERAQFISVIDDREQLLQAADMHMETEIAKLHEQLQQQMEGELRVNENKGKVDQDELYNYQESMQEEYQRHLQENMQQLEDTLNTQHSENLMVEINTINKTHKQEMKSMETELNGEWEHKMEQLETRMKSDHEQDKQQLRQTMEKEFSERLATTQLEMGKIVSKLEDTRKQLKELYGKYTKDTKNLARKVEIIDHELKKSKVSLEDYQRKVREQDSENKTQHSQVVDLGKQVDRAEKLRQEVVETMKKSEKEHEDIMASYKERCATMNEKVLRLDAQIKTVKAESHQQLLIMQESMEREHKVVVETLQAEMVNMSRKHAEDVRKLRKQYEHDKEQQVMDNTSKDDSAIHDMRDQYLEAVEKIREDVIKHMSQSNELAASTVRIQVIRERQLTARRLRRYYMKCLAHILDKDCDPVTKEHKLLSMEKYLDNLPERDSSRSTTPSIPSVGSTTPVIPSVGSTTPVTVASDPSRSYDILNSSSEIPEGFRLPQTLHAAAASRPDAGATSRPSSGTSRNNASSTSRGNDHWVTSRSHGAKLSSMTYPIPSLKTNSPAGSGKPPAGCDHRTNNAPKRHSRGKSLEQPVEQLRSQLDCSLDLGLSASTPDLTPRQVGFSDRENSRILDQNDLNDESTRRISDWSSPRIPDWSNHHHPVIDHVLNLETDSQHERSSDTSRGLLSVYRGESPMDDILDKYSIGHIPPRPTSVNDDDLPGSAKSTPGRIQFTLPRTDHGMSHSKSIEFLNREDHGQVAAPVLSTAKGYRYTSLRNILATRGRSKSSSNLHILQSDVTYTITSNRLELKTPPPPTQTKYKTPPERIPAPQKSGTPPKPQFVPKLQLQMLDIDLNTSENLGAITPRADQEVATFSAGQANRTTMVPPNLTYKSEKRMLNLQRPVPLVTRQTQAPESHSSDS